MKSQLCTLSLPETNLSLDDTRITDKYGPLFEGKDDFIKQEVKRLLSYRTIVKITTGEKMVLAIKFKTLSKPVQESGFSSVRAKLNEMRTVCESLVRIV